MPDSRIFEGKTTNEAIEKGLRELKVSKNDVEIKVIKDEEKRSFFDILAPRVVKVELMLKEKKQERKKEAGIRTELSENPEEANRILVDHASEVLCTPDRKSYKNLEKEGLKAKSYFTGDVMYDSFCYYKDKINTEWEF